jgi:hypothetical protein
MNLGTGRARLDVFPRYPRGLATDLYQDLAARVVVANG